MIRGLIETLGRWTSALSGIVTVTSRATTCGSGNSDARRVPIVIGTPSRCDNCATIVSRTESRLMRRGTSSATRRTSRIRPPSAASAILVHRRIAAPYPGAAAKSSLTRARLGLEAIAEHDSDAAIVRFGALGDQSETHQVRYHRMHIHFAIDRRPFGHRERADGDVFRIETVLSTEEPQHIELLIGVQGLENREGEIFHLVELFAGRALHHLTHRQDAERCVARLVDLDP